MRILRTLLAASAITATALWAPPSMAQVASPDGKGITGGALLGGEAVMMIEAGFGVKPWWAYLLGGVAGAAGGGVGGYFLEQSSRDAAPSLLLLTGGMAFVIPTIVLVANAGQYQPPADAQVDDFVTQRKDPPPKAAPSGARLSPQKARATRTVPSAPGRELRRLPQPPMQRLALRQRGLLGLSDAGTSLGVPAVEVRNVFTQTELQQFGLQQATEFRLPLLSAVF